MPYSQQPTEIQYTQITFCLREWDKNLNNNKKKEKKIEELEYSFGFSCMFKKSYKLNDTCIFWFGEMNRLFDNSLLQKLQVVDSHSKCCKTA